MLPGSRKEAIALSVTTISWETARPKAMGPIMLRIRRNPGTVQFGFHFRVHPCRRSHHHWTKN